MPEIIWGIIGCGDVAEVKSGPAFSKVKHSSLKAVMRRDLAKAEDFANRHNVPYFYNDAKYILEDSEINAVYIATPPASHLPYTLQALNAGKHVYLEKPMALHTAEAIEICNAVKASKLKLTVAHYRRRLPAFLKVAELLKNKDIGEVLFADIQILQTPKSDLVASSDLPWRFNSEISGGGLFHDLAPHQIDLMQRYFGAYSKAIGVSDTQNKYTTVDDVVNGIIQFKNGIQCRGIWSFNCAPESMKDECVIHGTAGKIVFSFFGTYVLLEKKGKIERFGFENPKHVQQPMIEAVVDYFRNLGSNPCPAEEALIVAEIMDAFCS